MRNHKVFRPLKKSYSDIYNTEYEDAIWMPETLYLSLVGDETGQGRGAVINYRAVKSGNYFDGFGKLFNFPNAVKRFEIQNESWDEVYQSNFSQLDSMLQLMRNLVKDRVANGDLEAFFSDATLIDLE